MATIGVLFRNADVPTQNNESIISPPSSVRAGPRTFAPIISTMPVSFSPAVTRNNAATISNDWLTNPPKASWAVMTPQSDRSTMAPANTRSAGFSYASAIRTTSVTRIVSHIGYSALILSQVVNDTSVGMLLAETRCTSRQRRTDSFSAMA